MDLLRLLGFDKMHRHDFEFTTEHELYRWTDVLANSTETFMKFLEGRARQETQSKTWQKTIQDLLDSMIAEYNESNKLKQVPKVSYQQKRISLSPPQSPRQLGVHPLEALRLSRQDSDKVDDVVSKRREVKALLGSIMSQHRRGTQPSHEAVDDWKAQLEEILEKPIAPEEAMHDLLARLEQ